MTYLTTAQVNKEATLRHYDVVYIFVKTSALGEPRLQ
jgi:hypothetical protein